MTPRLALLLAWIVVGAAVLVAHTVIVVRALRSELRWRHKALALLPPAAPFIAWQAGGRAGPIVWGVLLLAYLVLRLLEAVL